MEGDGKNSKPKNVYVDGEKMQKIKEELEDLQTKKVDYEDAKKKLKLAKKDANGEIVIKKLEHLSLLSDLAFEKKGIDDSRRISEAKLSELKNRVADYINYIANQEATLLAELNRYDNLKLEYTRLSKLERLEEHCQYGLPEKSTGRIE